MYILAADNKSEEPLSSRGSASHTAEHLSEAPTGYSILILRVLVADRWGQHQWGRFEAMNFDKGMLWHFWGVKRRLTGVPQNSLCQKFT